MNINKLVFRNFKTLENVSFEPGRVNVFIGANGSGKTTDPLVLDGLDLMNDDIRLFAVNKSRKSGHTTLQRIQITKELMDSGYSLSRLWTEGRLGGVPNL